MSGEHVRFTLYAGTRADADAQEADRARRTLRGLLAAEAIEAATIVDARGIWRGEIEASFAVEVIVPLMRAPKAREHLRAVARRYCVLERQESVAIAEAREIEFELIEAAA